MATVEFRQASRIYDAGRPPAVNRVNLSIADGEFLVLVGPSGCGKSTTLRMLAGLEPVDEGAILIDDVDVSETRARDRDVAMVFQSYALYPNMTARQNMAFALENSKMPKAEIDQRVTDAAAMLELDELLYENPGNTFVAGFIGSPAISLIDGVSVTDGQAVLGEGHQMSLGLPRELVSKLTSDKVVAGVRPEAWEILGTGAAAPVGEATVPMKVMLVEHLGSESFAYCEPIMTSGSPVSVRGGRVTLRADKRQPVHAEEVLHVRPRFGEARFFDVASEVNLAYL